MQTDNRVIYILGNPLVREDKKPIELIPTLRKVFPDISFVHIDPTEGFPQKIHASLVIIDTVLGINRVTVFDNLESFAQSPRMTVHEFDLPLELGILKKLGKLKKITIIGIPHRGDNTTIITQIREILR